MEEITLVFIKPDALNEWNELQIKKIYIKSGLDIVAEKYFTMDRKLAEEFYTEHRDKPFFEQNILHITSGIIKVLIIRGEDAVKRVREINGATNPDNAKPGTIRRIFGRHGQGSICPANAVHASDSEASAKRETDLLFGKGAYNSYKKQFCSSA